MQSRWLTAFGESDFWDDDGLPKKDSRDRVREASLSESEGVMECHCEKYFLKKSLHEEILSVKFFRFND